MKPLGQGAPSASTVASAYDVIAPDYDDHLRADTLMRRQLWELYARLFRPGMRVLDVGCGTGTDAIFLARHGVRVEAVDISPGMLTQFERKVRAAGLSHMVTARLLAASELAALPPASFDGVIAAYAVLNTVPDLALFSADAARLLRPHGRLVTHMLNPQSTWDLLAGGLRRRGPWTGAGVEPHERLVPIGGLTVCHSLWNADETYRRFFARHFRLVRAYGMGAIAPPAQRRLPLALLTILPILERRIGRWPCWRRWARFFVLELAARCGGIPLE